MRAKFNKGGKNVSLCLAAGVISCIIGTGAADSRAAGERDYELQRVSEFFSVGYKALENGIVLEEGVINGPPTPPPGFAVQRQAVALPEPDSAALMQTLDVPAYDWVFGCSAVSGAMIAAYYDRNGYPDIYTGPTDNGVMPLVNTRYNSSWPTWSDGYDTYPNCPLVASKNGVDGRATNGTIDNYWVSYDSYDDDPYITNGWNEHAYGDAIGDYMKTSQSAYDNRDGSTLFWNFPDATVLSCADMPGFGITNDGTEGRKRFYEARGYTVSDCYNQKTDNQVSGGFSFTDYMAEIDAGHPVMINLLGHTIVGIGYEDSTNTVYIHDTWDDDTHSMTWGGSYAGMPLQSVSIVHLAAPEYTLTDALAVLQVLAGISPSEPLVGDIDGDGFIGLAEVIYVLRDLAEL